MAKNPPDAHLPVGSFDAAERGLRIDFAPGISVGPEKAALMENIASLGSVDAAAESLGLQSGRAWGQVDKLNAMFTEPMVVAPRDGSAAARLTDAGAGVLAFYRRLEKLRAGGATKVGKAELAALKALLVRGG